MSQCVFLSYGSCVYFCLIQEFIFKKIDAIDPDKCKPEFCHDYREVSVLIHSSQAPAVPDITSGMEAK